MKRFILALGVVVLSACATMPANLPADSQVVYRANEVVVALGTLQHAAIQLNAVQDCGGAVIIKQCAPVLSDANTRIVVDAVMDALTTLKATPNGWQATASAALTRIQSRLNTSGKGTLAAYVAAVKTVAGL